MGVSCPAIHPWTYQMRTVPSERHLERSWVTPAHQTNEKIATSGGWLPSSPEPREASCASFVFSPSSSKSPVLPWKELEHTSVPSLCSWARCRGILALRTNGVCIHESHRTVANKEAVLRVQDPPPRYSYKPRLSTERIEKKKTSFHSFSWEGAYLSTFPAIAWGSSFQPASIWDPPLQDTDSSDTPSPTGRHQNECSLDNHKTLRAKSSGQTNWRGSSPPWSHLLYLMHRNQLA